MRDESGLFQNLRAAQVLRAVRALALVVLLLGVTALGAPVWAQGYSFAVPELRMQVYVQPDASVRIVYDFTFENYGRPIDIVDIGLPHEGYDIDTMSAKINGVNLGDIRTSEYIDVGVEVHLGSQAIPSGETGTLHFECTMPNMVYQDTTRKDYASLQITPTWFDEDLVRGTSNIRVAVHLPEGVQPDEALHQGVNFSNKALYQGRTVVVWQWQSGTATQPYQVGVSFPQRGMDRVVKMTLLDLTIKWLKDNPAVRFLLGAGCLILFTFLFFRFSGGTGFTVFVILAGGLLFVLIVSPLSVLILTPLMVPLIIVNELHLRSRRKTYLPPIAQVEGGGIKRGLTAPEAATLLELPLNKVLTLVIFGLLEKGIVRQTQADPLTVEVVEDYQAVDNPSLSSIRDRRRHRRQVAQQKGTVIHTYETYFIDALERNAGQPVSEIDFSDPMEKLIKIAAAKMKGFDLSDTQEYYRRVISRAMDQASSLGEIEAREEYLDKYLPWVMMNEDYSPVFTHRSYRYWPIWMRSRRVGGTAPSGGKAGSGGGRPSVGGRTTTGDVAGSFAGWAENTMGGLAAAILPGSLNVPTSKGGFVDLSGVDRVTGDVFEALAEASKSSGSGGGGGGCACACAGCACACACAGGGR